MYDEEEDMIAVRYYIDCPYVSKYKVYFNDELYIQTSDEELLLSASSFKIKNVVKVEAITKDKRVISSIETKPINYGDCNFDGTLDEKDLENMVLEVRGESLYFNKSLGDLNNDNKIDLKDMMILKLALDNKKDLRTFENKKVKVIYSDHEDEFEVKEGEVFTPSKDDGATSFTKNGEYFDEIRVYSDITITAVYEVKPTSLTINGPTKVTVGQKYTYTPYFTPLYSCDGYELILDQEYCTLNEDGTITFLKAGETEIKARSLVNGIDFSLKVTITGGN